MTEAVVKFLADLATSIGVLIAAIGTASLLNRLFGDHGVLTSIEKAMFGDDEE